MKPEIVRFIRAFLLKCCAYITHNALRLWFTAQIQMVYASKWHQFFLWCNKRLFFFFPSSDIVVPFPNGFPTSIYQSVMDSQSDKTSDGGLRCWDYKWKKGLWGARRGEQQVQLLRLSSVCGWRTGAARGSSGSSEFLCVAGRLAVQLSQEKGHPGRGANTGAVPKPLCNNIISSISCSSLLSINELSKAFHDHKTFRFSLFFLYIWIIYSQKKYSDIWQTFTSNDIEAEIKAKTTQPLSLFFFFFFFFLCFCLSYTNTEIGCLSLHRRRCQIPLPVTVTRR